MKNISLWCIALLLACAAQAQVHVDYIHLDEDGTPVSDPIRNNLDITIPKSTATLKSIVINSADLQAGHKLQILAVGETKDYTTPNTPDTLTFATNLLNKQVTIKHLDNNGQEIAADLLSFRFIPQTGGGNGGSNDDTDKTPKDMQASIDDYLRANYAHLEAKPWGYVDPSDKDQKVHIFFDYLGNSLLSAIPQGISNAQYVVHIIYPFYLKEPNKVSYSVKQKSGSFSSALLFNNTGIRQQIGTLQAGEKPDGITERKFLLGIATDDLTFDIIAATEENKGSKTVLETYTIKMSPVYHGSFDIGLLRTDLSNPEYTLVQDPNSANQVVKVSDESPKGVVTVMASFYVSPVILLESLLGNKKIPHYKLTGRSFLDDHKFYERFYPTIGVQVSDKVFENLFYGINWEVARGLCIFGGWHYGKVRTFEMPNFEPGVTPVTNDQFEYYQNTRWKTSTAFGIKLDIMIVRNLFGIQ